MDDPNRRSALAWRARHAISKKLLQLQCNGYDALTLVRNRDTKELWVHCSEGYWNEYRVSTKQELMVSLNHINKSKSVQAYNCISLWTKGQTNGRTDTNTLTENECIKTSTSGVHQMRLLHRHSFYHCLSVDDFSTSKTAIFVVRK